MSRLRNVRSGQRAAESYPLSAEESERERIGWTDTLALAGSSDLGDAIGGRRRHRRPCQIRNQGVDIECRRGRPIRSTGQEGETIPAVGQKIVGRDPVGGRRIDRHPVQRHRQDARPQRPRRIVGIGESGRHLKDACDRLATEADELLLEHVLQLGPCERLDDDEIVERLDGERLGLSDSSWRLASRGLCQ